jgi:hypothetical protein
MMIGLLLLLLLLLLAVVVEEEVDGDEEDLTVAAVPDGEMMAPPRGWKARRRLPVADDGILFMWPPADDAALLLLPATTEAITANTDSSKTFEAGDIAEFVLKRPPITRSFPPRSVGDGNLMEYELSMIDVVDVELCCWSCLVE